MKRREIDRITMALGYRKNKKKINKVKTESKMKNEMKREKND